MGSTSRDTTSFLVPRPYTQPPAWHGDRLLWLVHDELRASRDVASGEQPPPEGTALCKAFDDAAGGWPGGAAKLIPALGQADSMLSELVLEALAQVHPQRAVATQAARLARQLEAGRSGGDSADGSSGRRTGGSKKKRGKRR